MFEKRNIILCMVMQKAKKVFSVSVATKSAAAPLVMNNIKKSVLF